MFAGKNKKYLSFFSLLIALGLFLSACATPTPEVVEKVVEKVVKETQIVKETVKETVIVEGTPQIVEKEVTKVVEVEKVVTPTPEPTATPLSGPVSGGTLRFGMRGDFDDMSPHSLKWTMFPVRAQLYDTLIRYDHDVQAHPRLAESWEISDDGLTVTIKLRQGVKFHNGRELVAEDLVKNIEFAQDPETCLHMCAASRKIESSEAIDDYTFVLHYAEVDTGWMDFLDDFFIIAPESMDNLKTAPIGTGPFKFKEFIPDDHTTFVKNEDYWGSDGPYVDEVVIRPFGNDTEALLAALESGELDLVHEVSFKDKSRLVREGYQIFAGQPGAFINVIYINPNTVPEKKVRQAIFHGLDWEAMKEGAFYGTGTIGGTTSYPPSSWVYDEKFESSYSYDPEKAKALLNEAGYESYDLTFTTSSLEYVQKAVIMRDSLAPIGINLEVRPLDRTQHNEMYYGGKYQITGGYIANCNKDPDRLFLNSQYRCKTSKTLGPDYYWPVHPETGEAYCDLMDAGSASLDKQERMEIYTKIQEIMVDEAWVIGWLLRDALFGAQQYVHGFDWRIDNGILLENVWLEPH